MKRTTQVFFLATIMALCMVDIAVAGDDAPAWLRQAAAIPVGTYDKEVNAVVVLDEERVEIDSMGMKVKTKNFAVRILTREGKESAYAVADYLVNSGRVRDIQGWLLKRDGTIKSYDKKFIIDRILDPDDVYNEHRLKIIDGSDDAEEGSVFGYSAVTEVRPLYYQERWESQDTLPVLTSRFILALPGGWKANGVTFNHEPINPQIVGSTYTWELRGLPFVKDEPLSPSVVNIVPWVAINYGPDSETVGKSFANWIDVAKWGASLFDPQVVVDDAVAAKAQELTAGAKTELEKITAIGKFVQNIQYISIDIGVGNGNGYRPRPSNVVLNRGYGDCKDKANLMRALLRAIKIDAYPVVIFAGDPTFVKPEWVSPAQFNHCIIAIRVEDATKAPTVIQHEKLGRLLIFDATDPDTLVGDLPDVLQGSFALIVDSANGGLSRMPLTPSETNLIDRHIEVNLSSDGGISGTIKERSSGQASSYERARLRVLSAGDYSKMLELWLTRGAAGAKLIKFAPNDKRDEMRFDLDVEFSAPRYGQLMQRLLVFRPTIVDRRNALWLTEPDRKHPVILDSIAFRETVVFTLPIGFTVDETPENTTVDQPFGKYTTTYEVQGNKLIFKRTWTMNRATLSTEKYPSIRDFFSKMREAEQSRVVLMQNSREPVSH